MLALGDIMNKIAIIYISTHHNNTQRLVASCANVDIYKFNEIQDIDLTKYDLVGFASGIYFGKFHKAIYEIINNHLSQLHNIFLVYTSGSGLKSYGKKQSKKLRQLGLNVVAFYSCKGYDTYGPWKLFGGVAKNHPNDSDINNYRLFIDRLVDLKL